jgi:NAD(P)-dependent dehydrogenase (short-subunit alcohol dehydrogenase family)
MAMQPRPEPVRNIPQPVSPLNLVAGTTLVVVTIVAFPSFLAPATFMAMLSAHAGNFLAPAEELSSNGFRTVMEIDAVGTFNMCRAAFGALSNARDARIINISATLHYGATWYQALLSRCPCLL